MLVLVWDSKGSLRCRQRINTRSRAPWWFLFLKKYAQVTGACLRHTQCMPSQEGENFCSHCWGTLVYTIIEGNVLTLSDAGPCSITSQMSISRPGTSCLHGCWGSSDVPLGALRIGQVWCGSSASFPHTRVLITMAGPKVQTIYWPFIHHSSLYTNNCSHVVCKY